MKLLLDLLERCEKLDIRGWYRAKEELAALREAGEKMELALGKVLYKIAYSEASHPFTISEVESFREAFKAWEAANK